MSQYGSVNKNCSSAVSLMGLALAIRETELGEQVFPEICLYTLSETLNPEFLPNLNQVEEQGE
ncbi:DUF29 domain-containing protein [Nostoc sp. UIC 10630]|uniref:DUF29 domain-containing protein n=1 Tax=Nostoc sp. UIC 10630 TaxID=2100146 RepID=UPI001FB0ABC0|nr:DUF29 domain-containing protein [Nostoc sp. UIC 10630]